MLIISRRAHYFISARNEHVKEHLTRHYEPQRLVRTIDAYCVSNTLYRKAAGHRARNQQNANNRRRSSNIHINDRNSAANQMDISSGIPQLRDFIQGIPLDSQISETRHFLDTRLVTLLEKADLWLNASVAELAANQAAAPGFVQELQTELKIVRTTMY
jgi:hypothetical protein